MGVVGACCSHIACLDLDGPVHRHPENGWWTRYSDLGPVAAPRMCVQSGVHPVLRSGPDLATNPAQAPSGTVTLERRLW